MILKTAPKLLNGLSINFLDVIFIQTLFYHKLLFKILDRLGSNFLVAIKRSDGLDSRITLHLERMVCQSSQEKV